MLKRYLRPAKSAAYAGNAVSEIAIPASLDWEGALRWLILLPEKYNSD
jgi:hypothetical protein